MTDKQQTNQPTKQNKHMDRHIQTNGPIHRSRVPKNGLTNIITWSTRNCFRTKNSIISICNRSSSDNCSDNSSSNSSNSSNSSSRRSSSSGNSRTCGSHSGKGSGSGSSRSGRGRGSGRGHHRRNLRLCKSIFLLFWNLPRVCSGWISG